MARENKIRKITRYLLNSEFNRNIFTLATGTGIAQLIPLLIMPVLTRLYLPSEFGKLGLFTSIVSVLGAIAGGRYELAIMIPKNKGESLRILELSLFIALTVSIALYAILIIGALLDLYGINQSTFKIALWFIPVSVFLMGSFSSFNYLANKEKLYKAISIRRVVQNLITNLSHICFAIAGFGYIGLILGFVLGQIIAVLSLAKAVVNKNSINLFKKTIITKKDVAKRYIDYPKYDIPTALLSAASFQLPILLLGNIYGSSYSGYYLLTFQMLQLPNALISTSILDVFKEEASREFQLFGNAKRIFFRTLKKC